MAEAKCIVCGVGRTKLVDAQLEGEGDKLTKVKVCIDCWKNLWGKLLNTKGVKIA